MKYHNILRNSNFEIKIKEKDTRRAKIREFEEPIVHTATPRTSEPEERKPLKRIKKEEPFKFKTGKLTRSESSLSRPKPSSYVPVVDLGGDERPTGRSIIRNIYFKFDAIDLDASNEENLRQLVEIMNKRPKLKIEVGGHCDNIGTSRANLNVSQRRASSVVKYLVASGISADRVVAKGYGDRFPLASNDDELEGRELNRRIEVRLVQ